MGNSKVIRLSSDMVDDLNEFKKLYLDMYSGDAFMTSKINNMEISNLLSDSLKILITLMSKK